MRYIGNKTKLLSFIGEFLDNIGLQNGRALDAFAGTAAVGSYLKSRGFGVDTCDIMTFSYVLQRAYVVADNMPRFDGLAEDSDFAAARNDPGFASQVESRFHGQGDLFGKAPEATRPLEEALVYLDTFLSPIESFITENYSAHDESGEQGRMFFTRENAQRIDAVRTALHRWHDVGHITDDEYFVLLASLLEAADSVANTTGVYAAFVKTWQPNALKPLRLPLLDLVTGTERECRAYLGSIDDIITELDAYDLLYLDPPYNTRQYSAYYHVPEVIAQGWFTALPELRGKTGLIPNAHTKSAWSTKDGCVPALEELLHRADVKHVLLSYNSEGIIPETEIERIFKSWGSPGTYRRVAKDYKRYRADLDSDVRRYAGDRVTEYLYYVRKS